MMAGDSRGCRNGFDHEGHEEPRREHGRYWKAPSWRFVSFVVLLRHGRTSAGRTETFGFMVFPGGTTGMAAGRATSWNPFPATSHGPGEHRGGIPRLQPAWCTHVTHFSRHVARAQRSAEHRVGKN